MSRAAASRMSADCTFRVKRRTVKVQRVLRPATGLTLALARLVQRPTMRMGASTWLAMRRMRDVTTSSAAPCLCTPHRARGFFPPNPPSNLDYSAGGQGMVKLKSRCTKPFHVAC